MQYYTTEQVAEIFAISPKTVRKLITTGKMKAVKIGIEYRISDKELERFAVENETTGE
nr:helix-turn-helix domain-containing protein [uncultured Methanospirillum sp.]